MKFRLNSVFKSFLRFRLLPLLAMSAVVLSEGGCRVQAGNPQTNKPIKPGNVTVALADAPVDDMSNLFVTVFAIAFAPEGTGRCLKDPLRKCADSKLYYYELDKEIEVDLLSLSDGRTQVLPFSRDLPPGTYEGLRLFLSETAPVEGVLKADGLRVPVRFSQSPFGRKEFTIVEEFDVQEESENEILIHVDLRRSLVRLPDSGYALHPFVHVVPTRLAARLYGGVSDTSVTRICAYNVGGRRRPDGHKLKNDGDRHLNMVSDRGRQRLPQSEMPISRDPRSSQSMPHDSRNTVPRPGPGVPDPTSSCDNAEAVSDVKNGAYDLRYLPPVSYILRAFKSDGSYADTLVSVPLTPRESRVVDL